MHFLLDVHAFFMKAKDKPVFEILQKFFRTKSWKKRVNYKGRDILFPRSQRNWVFNDG